MIVFKKPRKPVCPKCGSEKILKIVYGLLRGDMKLDVTKYWEGGCCIEGDKYWHCGKCGKEFSNSKR